MTFLEYVCHEELGEPTGNFFHCPICKAQRPTLAVLPPKEGYPDKWKCHNPECRNIRQRRFGIFIDFGDECDIIEARNRWMTYGERLDYLHYVRLRYNCYLYALQESNGTDDDGYSQEPVDRGSGDIQKKSVKKVVKKAVAKKCVKKSVKKCVAKKVVKKTVKRTVRRK